MYCNQCEIGQILSVSEDILHLLQENIITSMSECINEDIKIEGGYQLLSTKFYCLQCSNSSSKP